MVTDGELLQKNKGKGLYALLDGQKYVQEIQIKRFSSVAVQYLGLLWMKQGLYVSM